MLNANTCLICQEWSMFIDDERYPGKDAPAQTVIVRSSQEAIKECMRRGTLPNTVMFDHDLGGNDTSMHFIRWMIDQLYADDKKFLFPSNFTYTVHSQNPVGSKNIKSLIDALIMDQKGN